MASEYILLFIGKYRYKIIVYSILLFVLLSGYLYFLNGRTYKASIDFYILNASFNESHSEEHLKNKLFPTVEELEILGSICKSGELFDTVVAKNELTKYYGCNSKIETIEKLKNATTIVIGKKGKLTVNVEDIDNNKAHQLANELMNEIYFTFIKRCKIVRTNTQEDLKSNIQYFQNQKEELLNNQLVSSKIPKEILEVPLDSLGNFKVINSIKKKTGLEFKEILELIGNIKRVSEIDNRLFTLNDYLNKSMQQIKSLNRNNLIVLNNTVPYKKNVLWPEHLLSAFKLTLLLNGMWIGFMLVFKHYEPEIDLFLKSNKKK